MYTNATEFPKKEQRGRTGISNTLLQKQYQFSHALLIYLLELTTWMTTGVLGKNGSLPLNTSHISL